jgi:hypothetical protein
MAAVRKPVFPADPEAHGRRKLQAIGELVIAAVELCVEARIEETVRKWLARARVTPDVSCLEALAAIAPILASELAIFTPSMTGVRPIDRLARQFKAASLDDAATMESLRTAKFRLFRVMGATGEHIFKVEDLASGQAFLLFDQSLSAINLGWELAARIAWIGDDLHVATGPKIPLDGVRFAAAREFIRPGRGLINDQRCAAAVYRDFVRHGVAEAIDFSIALGAEEAFTLSRPDEELDALAGDWAARPEGAEPSSDDLDAARRLTGGHRVGAALVSSVESRAAGKKRLADVYRRLALIQMETLHRRALAGSGEADPLQSMRGAFEELAARNGFPAEALDLYRELTRQISLRTGGTGGHDENLGRVIERIRALRAKTIEQGCSEQEALAAAAKVAEMLERYGLSLSEVEIRAQPCEGFGVDTGRRQQAPSDRCVPAIADFCDCRVWSETGAGGTLRFIFFGLPADVEAAHSLYDLVAAAFDTETATFKSGPVYAEMRGADKRGAIRSFQIGLAGGLGAKLQKLKAQRNAAVRKSGGRDLVPIKSSILDEEFEKLGLSLHAKRLGGRRKVLAAAYQAGHAAGGRFEVHAAIE